MKEKTTIDIILDFVKNTGNKFEVLSTYYKSNEKIKLKCNVDGHEWSSTWGHIKHGRGCPICAIEKRRKIVEISLDEKQKILSDIGSDVKTLKKLDNIFLLCSCSKGHIWKAKWGNLRNGNGCPVCSNKKIIPNENSLNSLRPDLMKYLKNKEDGNGVTIGSSKKIGLKCPDCGFEKSVKVYSFVENGMACHNCGDHISYPEKFLRGVLNELKIPYVTEKSFEWSNNKRYDFYIESLNILIEVHGRQHYFGCNWANKKSQRKNDIVKKEMSLKNGITVVEVDARISNFDFIKNSCIESMGGFLDLKNINWDKVMKFSFSNLRKDVARMYMTGEKNIEELSKRYSLSGTTIRAYLKDMAKIGLCDYDPIVASTEAKAKSSSKKIARCDLNYNIIEEFSSIKECCERYDYNRNFITYALKRKDKIHYGSKWKYLD